ncbi:MAG TPA: metal-dependent transcriptional regulator [Gemmatimonadaceae bacterium]|nr:metal-dependent transcriptional regulator [Gemmatimonadaceae bacterium]
MSAARKRAVRPETPPERPARSLTAPVEDYLKAIYELERQGALDADPRGTRGGAGATTSEIAERLALSPASVSGMVRRLAEHGLLAHTRYRGVRLTARGREAALRTIRRHRVLEAYLARALGLPWDRVHEEAERLEHAASDDLIDRMATTLGEPAVDPHGAPIPRRDGTVDERRHPTLAQLAVGARARIVMVSDEDADRLRYLGELGLRPGASVAIVARAPFDGPISVRTARGRREIGPALAAQILVEDGP